METWNISTSFKELDIISLKQLVNSNIYEKIVLYILIY